MRVNQALSCLTTVKALYLRRGIVRGSMIADRARCSSDICTLKLAASRTHAWKCNVDGIAPADQPQE